MPFESSRRDGAADHGLGWGYRSTVGGPDLGLVLVILFGVPWDVVGGAGGTLGNLRPHVLDFCGVDPLV